MARIRKRNGVYQAIFYDAEGKRVFKSTHCSDARAAEAAARRFERTAQDPDLAAQEDPTTLADTLNALLANLAELAAAGRRSLATVDYHRDKAASLLFGLGGELRIGKLSAPDVDGFISLRRRDGASESTIAKELVTLRQALKLALRQGRWRGDVRAVLPVAFAAEYRPRERFLSPDELARLLSRLTEDNAARVAFAVATSANLGECERAQRADVAAGAVRIRGTKRATRARYVPVVLPWQRELLDYCLTHAKGDNGALFRASQSYHNALRRACLAEAMPHVSPNDLRRTYCHWMRQTGMPRELVASAMGHGNTAMVDKVYGRLTPDELGSLMRRALGASGTPVAQTHAQSVDALDESGIEKASKNRNLVGRPRFELGANGLKVPLLHLPSPRKHREKRTTEEAGGTHLAQRRASFGARRGKK